MRRFLYFIPGVSGLNEQMASNFGLLGRFIDAGGGWLCPTLIGCDCGPGGKTGCLFGHGAEHPVFNPQTQTWIQSEVQRPNAEPLKFWVGMQADLRPAPSDLARSRQQSGYEVALCDQNKWVVPLVKKFRAGRFDLNLPRVLGGLKAGQPHFIVKPQFRKIDQIGDRVINWYFANVGQPVEFEGTIQACADLLATNYFVGLEECILLGLFDESSLRTILLCSIDSPQIDVFAEAALTDGTFTPKASA